MNFVGVDGCRKGWIAVVLDSGHNWKIDVYKSIGVLWEALSPPLIMLIDIPIGLPESDRRACDLETRKLLGPRGSSVFAVPCRKALKARTYRRACRINRQTAGVKLSLQTWNIFAKIKEVDQWLQNNRQVCTMVRESHPELCFWSLSGGHAMAHSKKTVQGFSERHTLLQKHYTQTVPIVDQALGRYRRKDLARDDILDALVLAISARYSSGSPITVPLKTEMDKKGRPMEIVYALPR